MSMRFIMLFFLVFAILTVHMDILELVNPINWKSIRSQWNNIVNIMLLLSMRSVQQSPLTQIFCDYKNTMPRC